ncbi:MAG: PepSY-associated TM helix domain-containing protein [Rhodanobacteraceae bacterium]
MKPSLSKTVLFRIHWILGITAGLVLAVVGVTGAMIAFEAEILRAINPSIRATAAEGPIASPSKLIDAARATHQGYNARSFAWEGDDAPVVVRLAKGSERGGLEVAVDPPTAAVLGTPRGKDVLDVAEQLHRNLAAGPAGKQIVGASTAILLVLAVTGIILRWPRRSSWRAWLTFNPKLRGRGFLWHLHSVAATWLLAFYLIAALTGLWWSYDFYRNAINSMAGVSGPLRRPGGDGKGDLPPATIDEAWSVFRREASDATRANLGLAGAADAPVEIRYQTPASPHERAWNTLRIDGTNGTVASRELYADLPRGRRFVFSIFPLHSGGFFGWPGRLAMALAALLMPFFAVTGLLLWIARRRNLALRAEAAAGAIAPRMPERVPSPP